ncbi:dihydrolipoyllysine-residue acetyltransferase component of pyruvate dehydrogenase complex [Acrasis kona]|uniref:Dihydrolipoyllysine-residue acetyltransferase component of pyruvate dehydrogenase complex n=1 Tax=Acrasis kona TaxID=1008807 RepID=A0AAW2ZI41_9EUKA
MPSVAILLANNKWVKPELIKGTGKAGRLSKGDVLLFLKNNKEGQTQPQSQPQQPSKPSKPTPQKYTDVATTKMRKIIATRLLESKQTIPHSYMTVEACLDHFLTNIKPKIKVSVNDYIIYCVAKALEQVPECNAVLDPKNGSHEQKEQIDISFAVSTDTGLITPIVKNTNHLRLENLSERVKDLSGRARQGKLKTDEFQGGTFCISNLGMFGVSNFAAVINPPHAVILAIGGGIKKPKTPNMTLDLDDFADGYIQNPTSVKDIEYGTFISITAASDTRAVDGATVGRFLSALKNEISQQ